MYICFREDKKKMKRCSSSISDTSSDTSSTSEPCSSDDDAAVDKKRKEEDEDLWHHLPFWMEPSDAQPDDEPMDFCEGDSSDFDYDMYDEAADHATWVEWAQREKEKKEVGVFFNNNNNMG